MNIETRVGLFVVATLAALIAFVMVLGDFRWGDQYSLAIDYAHIGGLQTGAPVKLAGMTIGSATSISVVPPSEIAAEVDPASQPIARVLINIDPSMTGFVTSRAKFSISSQGLVGESFIDIQPVPDHQPPLPENSVVRGTDPPRLTEMSTQVSTLLERVDTFLTNEQAIVDQALQNTAEISNELKSILKANATAIDETIKHMHRASRAIDHASTEFETIAQDKTLSKTLQTLNQTASHLATVSARLERGEGTVGGLLKDDQMYQDLKALASDVRAHPWKLFWKK